MTPSEQACRDQFRHKDYPGTDNWSDTQLHQGNVIYVWEADGQTSHGNTGDVYATTPNTVLACNGDPNALQDSLQTNVKPTYDNHRGHLQAYEINGDIDVAFAHCEANRCYGQGGGDQYFIPNFDQLVESGQISRANDLNIDFDKSALPVDKAKAESMAEAADIQKHTNPPSITPSEGTKPTLEGSYTDATPNLHKDLKPRVDEAQANWNSQALSKGDDISNTINNAGNEAANSLGSGIGHGGIQ